MGAVPVTREGIEVEAGPLLGGEGPDRLHVAGGAESREDLVGDGSEGQGHLRRGQRRLAVDGGDHESVGTARKILSGVVAVVPLRPPSQKEGGGVTLPHDGLDGRIEEGSGAGGIEDEVRRRRGQKVGRRRRRPSPLVVEGDGLVRRQAPGGDGGLNPPKGLGTTLTKKLEGDRGGTSALPVEGDDDVEIPRRGQKTLPLDRSDDGKAQGLCSGSPPSRARERENRTANLFMTVTPLDIA
ncbi:hypothetical protein KAR29_10460 [Aminithiophilus ramosus]|uniref:Uncharacterized protein n=2 Tax=Synergistales TaxID=649776 RepID=A0A9Q7AAT9_9BACT|nr:hypothetical protein [Aminithiophilus ramosus]QTX31758.1 hypothetical protein KAR29_10460 [Aminithiophilus ramosus]QVL35580.1 hypothetical protein KIH16_10390 [Synergistota bacterium]